MDGAMTEKYELPVIEPELEARINAAIAEKLAKLDPKTSPRTFELFGDNSADKTIEPL